MNSERWIAIVCLYACGASQQVEPKTIVIGAVPTTSDQKFIKSWSPTFETFLNEEVGKIYVPPLSFSLVTLNMSSAFDAVSKDSVDFIFANPSLYACLDYEYSGPAIQAIQLPVNRDSTAHT